MGDTTSLLLRIKNLSAAFVIDGEPVPILDSVGFDLHRGEVLGIVGESGSGKTILCLSLLGLLPQGARITGGELIFDGQRLGGFSPGKIQGLRGREIGMIFQEPMTSFDPVYTIGSQISESLRRHRGLDRRSARQSTVELLSKVGIADPDSRYDEYPFQLSGGMRQRAMIAMALAPNPKLLIADEPTTALDVTIQAQVLELLKELQQETGITMLFISHNLGVIAEVAGEVLVMYAGRMMERAPVERLFDDPMHPYTRALMAARPRLQGKVEPLRAIGGQAPGLGAAPPGCPFQPRCASAMEICAAERPVFRTIDLHQHTACHLYNDEEARQ